MKRVLIAVVVLLLLGAGAVGAYVIDKWRAGRDVHGSPSVEFVSTAGPEEPQKPKSAIVWPMFGYDQRRTHLAPSDLRPPFRKVWAFRGAQSLLEFPPAIAYRRLYLTTNHGDVLAVGAKNGLRAWRYRARRCVAASPAVSGKLVFQAFMNRRPCNAEGDHLDGLIAAFYVGSGKVRWKRRIGPSETSPLVAEGRVFVGDWDGNIWALNGNSGKVRWRFHADGQVKSGIAYASGRVYFGTYGHSVYALRARDGKLVWRASAQERLGSPATFYSTPAVAYGRVYIGGTDGRMYSFGASSGKLRWSHDTGNYVYGSPGVWHGTVYAGSYTGTFYAFDAATGDVRWTFDSGGPISGSPTLIDGIVYFATLKERTYALDARTGRMRWSYPDGKYSPVVADEKRLYLVGYARLYGLIPSRARRSSR